MRKRTRLPKEAILLPDGQVAVPFPDEGILFFGGARDGGKPTAKWIGKPSEEDIELFLWFLFENVASRPPGKGRHQTKQIQGTFVSYGRPNGRMKGSDFSQRIYAAVRLLETAGRSNKEACSRVAECPGVRAHLLKSNRGRQRETDRAPDFLDLAEDVRSLYNDYKSRHHWPQKLPQRDLELEHWWSQFLKFKEWAEEKYALVVKEAKKRGTTIEEFCKTLAADGHSIHQGIARAVCAMHAIRLKAHSRRGSDLG